MGRLTRQYIIYNINQSLDPCQTQRICESAGRTPLLLLTLLLLRLPFEFKLNSFALPFEFRLFGESNQKLLPDRSNNRVNSFLWQDTLGLSSPITIGNHFSTVMELLFPAAQAKPSPHQVSRVPREVPER